MSEVPGFGSPNAINNHGLIAGWINNADDAGYYHNGTITPLGTLGGNYADALDVNDDGLIVGALTNHNHIQPVPRLGIQYP